MASNEVNELLITKEELIRYLPPNVLKETLSSLKMATEITATVYVWRGPFVQYERSGEPRYWIFDNSEEVTSFTTSFVQDWKNRNGGSRTQFNDSYDRQLNCDEYMYEMCGSHPIIGETERLVLTLRRRIVKRD